MNKRKFNVDLNVVNLETDLKIYGKCQFEILENLKGEKVLKFTKGNLLWLSYLHKYNWI